MFIYSTNINLLTFRVLCQHYETDNSVHMKLLIKCDICTFAKVLRITVPKKMDYVSAVYLDGSVYLDIIYVLLDPAVCIHIYYSLRIPNLALYANRHSQVNQICIKTDQSELSQNNSPGSPTKQINQDCHKTIHPGLSPNKSTNLSQE